MSTLPLQDTRVVSFNHYMAGPLGMQLLADMGADVIAVEPIGGAWHRQWGGYNRKVDGQSVLFLAANRNKRSLALNLKVPEGIAVAKRLLATADVMAENFRPGVMAKLGLGYEDLRKVNPKLIYASVSGYGQDGPYTARPGQDLLIQALSGLATITGNSDDKARAVGVSVADHHGATLLAMGILGALVARGRSGVGSRVDVDLLSAALDLQTESFVCYLNGSDPGGTNPPPHIAGWYYSAPYGIYPTRDGHIAFSLSPIESLAGPLELPALGALTPADAFGRRAEIASMIAAAVGRRCTAEWLNILAATDIWHAPVNNYRAVISDPQVRHNGSFVTAAGATGSPITVLKHPVRYDGEAPTMRLPPQPLGAQTKEILGEIGYSSREIGELISIGVVASAPEEYARAQ